MGSIGNDIVDLNFIDKARTRSFPFYSRILSIKEQEQYQASFKHTLPFEQYVWLLWSCKEAVYKFLKRHQPELKFSPVKICLEPVPITIGIMEFKNNQNPNPKTAFCKFSNPENSDPVFCCSAITPNYVHTIAYNAFDFDEIISDVKQIESSEYEGQSVAVRNLLSNKLRELIPDANISFFKNDTGCPVILNGGKDTEIITSFSHHGNYVAYALKMH